MKILCIGDSNTYGYDPRSYIGSRYAEGIPWADRLDGCACVDCHVAGDRVCYQRYGLRIELYVTALVGRKKQPIHNSKVILCKGADADCCKCL